MKAFRSGIVILLSQFTLVSFGQTADPLDTWHIRANYNLNSIAFGNDIFVAVGGANNVVVSTNGIMWTRVVTPIPVWGPVAFLKDFFMTRGGNNESQLLISTNGVLWSVTGRNMKFDSVAIAPDRFVVVSTGEVSLSYDGLDWIKTISQPGMPLKEVAFGNGVFVATLDYPWAITSSDGVAWIYSEYLPACCSVTFGNEIFLSMSRSSVSSSVDGLNWSAGQQFPYDWGPDYRDVSFGGGRFVAVGRATISPAGALVSNVVSSVDGVTWKWHGAATVGGSYHDLYAVTYGQGTFVAVGSQFIIQSAPVTDSGPTHPTLTLSSYAGVRIDGPAGRWYRIERTETLRNTNAYVPVTNIFVRSSPTTWIDFDSPNARTRFYRAIVLP